MNTTQLQCFLAVAETLNFARAAERLNVTQPAVTQQIHALENELNVKLFHRTTRTVELTESGKLFINDAKGILTIAERAQKRFQKEQLRESQFFSVGCHTFAEVRTLAGPLRLMRLQYPALHPLFQVIPFRHLFQLLEDDTVECIMAFRENDKTGSGNTYKELTTVPVVAVCAPDHPLSGFPTLGRSKLQNEKLILCDPVKFPASIAAVQSRFVEEKPVEDLFFCESSDAAVTLAAAGCGIAILPQLFVPESENLVCVPLANTDPMSYGAYLKKGRKSPLQKLFLSAAQTCFEKNTLKQL